MRGAGPTVKRGRMLGEASIDARAVAYRDTAAAQAMGERHAPALAEA
jgi:hypothetical protein